MAGAAPLGLSASSGSAPVTCVPAATRSAAVPPALPDEFAAWDAAARTALAAAARADEWDAPARAGALAWLAKHRDLVALVESRVLIAERQAGTWSLRGDRDLASFAGRVSREGRGAGFSAVGRAATLSSMPRLAVALADGPVTTTHLAEVTRAAASSPLLAEHLTTDEGQAAVVELAARLDGTAFGKELRRRAASLDPAARQRTHDEQRARRFLTLSHTPGGTLVKGLLDSVAGYKLAKALDAHDPRPAVDDDRDRDQRRVDALAAMVDRALTERAAASGPIAPAQGIVTFSERTWAALRSRRDAAGSSDGAAEASSAAGSAADVVTALRGAPPVVDETGAVWPASEVARALCGCALTRAVVDAAGQTLDLGRESRLFTRAHWLALHASGVQTCGVDGCGIPLRFAELHHMAWWDRDRGPTDLECCAPECSYHHHEIHRLDIRVARRADGSFEHRHPDGRLYGGSPPVERDDGSTGPTGVRRGTEPRSGGRGRDQLGAGGGHVAAGGCAQRRGDRDSEVGQHAGTEPAGQGVQGRRADAVRLGDPDDVDVRDPALEQDRHQAAAALVDALEP